MAKKMSYAKKFARKGGKSTATKKGVEYMAMIGRKGGLKRVDNLRKRQKRVDNASVDNL